MYILIVVVLNMWFACLHVSATLLNPVSIPYHDYSTPVV